MSREYVVEEFTYNGFMGTHNPTIVMPYTARFEEWTTDPGIAVCLCSDGERRLIPTYALRDVDHDDLPVQQKTGVLFGVPSNS